MAEQYLQTVFKRGLYWQGLVQSVMEGLDIDVSRLFIPQ